MSQYLLRKCILCAISRKLHALVAVHGVCTACFMRGWGFSTVEHKSVRTDSAEKPSFMRAFAWSVHIDVEG
jgi:hypothetical protein